MQGGGGAETDANVESTSYGPKTKTQTFRPYLRDLKSEAKRENTPVDPK